MDFDLKKAKFFSTKEENARQQAAQHKLDAMYGNPVYELNLMYRATTLGKYAFQSVTFLSTAAFLFRVTFSHVAELIGDVAAFAICGTVSVLASIAIEKMLEGNHVPFWKKFFLTWKADIVLGLMAIVFTGVVVAGAFSGMMVVGEGQDNSPAAESTTDIHRKTQEQIDNASNEISRIQNCQQKGGFCLNGKITAKGTARIDALTAEKAALLQSLNSTTSLVGTVNLEKKTAYEAKLEKAQKYLGRIAIGSELIKIMCFVFWGYRSREMALYKRKNAANFPDDDEDEEEIVEDETYDTWNQEEEMGNALPPVAAGGTSQMADPVYRANLEEYTRGIGYRRTLATRVKEANKNGSSVVGLKSLWKSNEERIEKSSIQLNQTYIRLPFPS
jgi:low affinity Fe/Cu permease